MSFKQSNHDESISIIISDDEMEIETSQNQSEHQNTVTENSDDEETGSSASSSTLSDDLRENVEMSRSQIEHENSSNSDEFQSVSNASNASANNEQSGNSSTDYESAEHHLDENASIETSRNTTIQENSAVGVEGASHLDESSLLDASIANSQTEIQNGSVTADVNNRQIDHIGNENNSANVSPDNTLSGESPNALTATAENGGVVGVNDHSHRENNTTNVSVEIPPEERSQNGSDTENAGTVAENANVLVETTNQQIEYQERIEAVPAVATDGNIDVDETGDELLYEDDEGGFRFEDIVIPPPIKPYCSSESIGPRLIITKIVNTNFKSYAGDVELGPFNQCFHAIIGPNGSGKSNVIDSMLFVFGYRANQIRCKKLSVLIHNSNKHQNVQSCRVAVHFAKIVDKEDGTCDEVPGSRFVVSREAFRNDSSQYRIDGVVCTGKQVKQKLMAHNIDLDHNRFLILQGEVESIAMMKPKAQKIGETGHLEYLEDIIGTSRYKEPLEKITARVDALTEERTMKFNRCKLAERELNDLKQPMNEAISYLTLENQHTSKRNKFIQVQIYDSTKAMAEQIEQKGQIEQKLKEHDEQFSVVTKERMEKEAKIEEETAHRDQIIKKKEEIELTKNKLENECHEIRSTMEQTNKRRKDTKVQLKKKEEDLVQLRNVPIDSEREIKLFEAQIRRLKNELAAANGMRDRNLNELPELIRPFAEEKEKLQGDMMDVQQRNDIAKSELDVEENELKLVLHNETTEKRKYEDQCVALEETKQQLQQRRGEFGESEQVVPRMKTEVEQCENQIAESKATEGRLQIEVNALRREIEEKSAQIQQARSNNNVLNYLMDRKNEGTIPGIFGRLGDLGAIDKKYDIAISTCCGRLDYILVDTVDTAEKCIQALKDDDVGRGNFITLEKIQNFARFMAPIQTPENVPRLFDLIHIEDERIAVAFYFVLQSTLVANDMEQASRIAYGTTRFRVITLDGKLIETSGTMSGGGKKPTRGKMGEQVKTRTNSRSNAGENAGENLDQLRERAQAKQDEINHMQQIQGEFQRKLLRLKAELPAKEASLRRAKVDIDTYAQQIPALERMLEEQREMMQQTRADPVAVATLQDKIADKKRTFDTLQAEVKKFTDQIDVLTKRIDDITNENVGGLEKSIELITKNIKKIQNQILTHNVAITNSKRNVEKAEEAIETMKNDIETFQNDLRKMHEEREQKNEDLEKLEKELQDLLKEIAEGQTDTSDIKKEIAALKKQEANAQLARVEMEQAMQKVQKNIANINILIPNLQNQLKPLKLHQIPDEEPPQPLKTYTNEELAKFDTNDLEYRIAVLSEEIANKTPNLNIIEEYQRKRDVYIDRLKVFDEITNKQNEAKKLVNEVRKRRFNEFMNGFSVITRKLKEMYQMITQGGNAELELVDSMDPFSEGIAFSVRPPRKSWKNISNLSGGEKTLSSLALVFALHYYKPSPLYFMDEIDAALDFKNVSIVANYIKERTRNAQFIIISLRTNMFELADWLTGIYKVDDCTDSLSIPNAVPMIARGATQSSSQRSTQQSTFNHYPSSQNSQQPQSSQQQVHVPMTAEVSDFDQILNATQEDAQQRSTIVNDNDGDYDMDSDVDK